jgi:hypothetical protein
MSAFGGKADIDEREIENLLGTDRINYLMAYSGLRRDDLLNSLSRELSIEWAQIWRLSIRLGGRATASHHQWQSSLPVTRYAYTSHAA